MATCPNCGAGVVLGTRLCPNCGLQLSRGGGGGTPPPPAETASKNRPTGAEKRPRPDPFRDDSYAPADDAAKRPGASRSRERAEEPRRERAPATHGLAVVVREPDVREEPRGCNPLAALALIAVILVLLPTIFVAFQAFAVAAIYLLLPIIVVIVILVMLGLGGIMRSFGSTAMGCLTPMLFMGGRRGPGRQRLVMTFSTAAPNDRTGRTTSVRLVGHGDGINQGDTVRVRGARMMGRVEALVVNNQSNGRMLLRSGLVFSAVCLAVFVSCVVILLTRYVGS